MTPPTAQPGVDEQGRPLKPLTRPRRVVLAVRRFLFAPRTLSMAGRIAFTAVGLLGLVLAGQALTNGHRTDVRVDRRFAAQQAQTDAIRAQRDRQIAEINQRITADTCAVLPLLVHHEDPRVQQLYKDLRCPQPFPR
jgi:hypothetical protein